MDTPATFAVELLESAAKAVAATRVIVQVGAQHIKTEARNNVLQSAPTHNAHAAYAITYDTGILRKATTIDAEIGYDKSKPGGALGNLLEYGGGGDHSPPHRDLGRALDVEEPKFVDALEKMAKGLL